MGMVRVFGGVAVYVVLLAACGSSPTAPSPPSISGQWTGAYRVSTCTEPVPPTGLCAALGGGGDMTLTPSQSGSNFTGLLTMGVFGIPVSGNVGADNVVTLAGSGPISTATLTVTAWRAILSGASMTGTMTFTVFGGGQTVIVNATTALAR